MFYSPLLRGKLVKISCSRPIGSVLGQASRALLEHWLWFELKRVKAQSSDPLTSLITECNQPLSFHALRTSDCWQALRQLNSDQLKLLLSVAQRSFRYPGILR